MPTQLQLPRLKTAPYARPTMELGTAAGVLHKQCPGITEDQVRQLIERGAFWAWNVALETDTRADLRLLTYSVAACANVADLLDDAFALAEPVPATAQEAIALLLHHAARITQSGKPRPWVTGEEIKLILNIRRTHMINLVDAKALPQMSGTQYRPGPNGYPVIDRDIFTAFLEARLVC